MQASTQKKIDTTSIYRYTKSLDQRIHVVKYNSYMTSVEATDATKCRLFLLTLSDQAHMWFTSLSRNSVNTFEKLATLFLGNFAAIAPRPVTKQRPMNTQQGEKESD